MKAGWILLGCGLAAALQAADPLPSANERGVDHARIIASWDAAALRRGEKLYQSICASCHGTPTEPGSLPTSRLFWKEPFKNGQEPLSLYRTITDGYGQMPAWPWLTPELRYDVVHFIREEFLKSHRPEAYFTVTPEYLAGLPKPAGGPAEKSAEMREFEKGPKYLRMEFGQGLLWTYQVAPGNIAYKGLAIRLDPGPGGVSRGRAWMIYDHDTMRVAAGWTGDAFIDWRGIAFDGSHGTHASIVGEKMFVNPVGPGWARPGSDSFEDQRFRGRDGLPYGPLPRGWARFHGLFTHGEQVVVSYSVGDADILELPALEQGGQSPIFARTLNVSESRHDLALRVAPEPVPVALVGNPRATLERVDGFNIVRIPAAATPLRIKVLIGGPAFAKDPTPLHVYARVADEPRDLIPLTRGGPARWPEPVINAGILGSEDGPFAVDELPVPGMSNNPWNAWLRPGGIDFFEDGRRAALCMWNGDVWIVDGLDGALERLSWRRIASGLFQPLGVRIVEGIIHVGCRDMIARLHDRNGDGEVDFVENFNNDHQVTEHFHEFAMGLQTDSLGNFYYAKSARHALPALVPHHGTLLKVSPDGARTEILANGFRAANGVCVNGDGTFFVTDQEGHWHPKNRINWVRPGGFYGNMMAYDTPTSSADGAMEQPLVWITNEMDRSPGELLWVSSDTWGPFKGSLLNLSYGTGRVFLVPHEKTGPNSIQGGVIALPIPDFPTGVMRGRFHPRDGHLYACGMFAWAGNQTRDGGFYRIRYTGRPAVLPIGLRAVAGGMELTFTDDLDPGSVTNTEHYKVKVWGLRRSANYGSPHLDEHELKVASAGLVNDNPRILFLELPELQPTRCMEIVCELRTVAGETVRRRVHSTVHTLGD